MAERRRWRWLDRGRLRRETVPAATILTLGLLTIAWLSRPAVARAADSCLPAVRVMCDPNLIPTPLADPRPAPARVLIGSQIAPNLAHAGNRGKAPSRTLSLAPRQRTPERLVQLDEQLLRREISNVSRLLRRTPSDHAEHPRALRRLAESYVELAQLQASRYAHNRRLARALRSLNPARAAMLGRRAGDAAKQERRARVRAVRLYRQLLVAHPHYCRFASHPDVRSRSCGDEVLRYLGNELEQLHEPELADRSYAELRAKWPGSEHAPAAALAQGEWHFKAAKQDRSHWSLAQQAYQEVLKYPKAAPQLRGYAAYKLGHVHWSLGRYRQALAELTKATRLLAEAAPRSRDAQHHALLDASRHDLVAVYALAGDANQALAFFLPLSGDPPGTSARAQAMVLELGEAMQRSGQLEAVGALYQQLASQTQDAAARCSYQAVASRATEAAHPAEPEVIAEALAALQGAYLQARDGADRHAAAHCRTTLLEVAGETALAWRIETLGDGQAAGTQRPETIAAALRVFGWLVPLHHGRSELHYAHGELLLKEQFYAACGEPFEAAFSSDPQGARSTDAALAASRCWLRQQPEAASLSADRMALSTTPKQVGREALGRLRMYEQLACRVVAPDQDGDAAREYASIANLRTLIYLEQGRLDAATALQRDIALHSANTEASLTAARAYLHGMDRLQQQDQLPQCAATQQQDSLELSARHCSPALRHSGSRDERSARAKLCRALSSAR